MATIDTEWNEMRENLLNVIDNQARIIKSIAEKMQLIEIGGGGSGNATFIDYPVEPTPLVRNNVVVDTETETCYRVLIDYTTSGSVQTDCQASYVILTNEPIDWSTNYTSYYVKTGEDTYEHVTGETAPTFVVNMFYKYTPKLKLLAAEGQILPFNGSLSQSEIDNLPNDALVAIYSNTMTPYNPNTGQ